MFGSMTLVGRLGADPEKRKTKDDKTFVTFSVAVDTGKDETLWVDVSMFGARGKTFCEHAKKGSAVGLSGKVRPREFEANDGTKVKTFSVTTEDFTFISTGGGKKDESAGGDDFAAGGEAASAGGDDFAGGGSEEW